MTIPTINAPVPYVVRFSDGAEAQAVAYAQGVLHLVCNRSHPPGRPLAFEVVLGDATLALVGKSAGSKRRDEDNFDVRVRLSSLRREQRERLERDLAAR